MTVFGQIMERVRFMDWLSLRVNIPLTQEGMALREKVWEEFKAGKLVALYSGGVARKINVAKAKSLLQ